MRFLALWAIMLLAATFLLVGCGSEEEKYMEKAEEAAVVEEAEPTEGQEETGPTETREETTRVAKEPPTASSEGVAMPAEAASIAPPAPLLEPAAPGINTIQTAGLDPATAGQTYTFDVTVTNNSVPQHVGLKDFLPEGMELVSVTPSQGTCGTSHHGSNAVECTLGDLPSGGSATVGIVVLPTVPGTMTNTVVGGGKHSPANPNKATITVNPAPK